VPAAIDVVGAPEITGALFGAALTVMENAGREALRAPSLTEITTLDEVPAATGVPDSRPVVVLKLAQEGRLDMVHVRVCPSTSVALGWKTYAALIVAVVPGVPLIRGALLVGAVTLIENAGKEALNEPSETVMTIFEYVPVWLTEGVPDSVPVVVLNDAHLGRFAIENVRACDSASEAAGAKL
jgi:hypothetical protein